MQVGTALDLPITVIPAIHIVSQCSAVKLLRVVALHSAVQLMRVVLLHIGSAWLLLLLITTTFNPSGIMVR